MNTNYRNLFDVFFTAIPGELPLFAAGKRNLVLPAILPTMMKDICQSAMEVFRNEQTIVTVTTPVVIVGDLHGHLLDLYRVLANEGLPSRRRYLFLGDLVDRGEFSIETVAMIFLMKILWPSNVFLIRGNHEFAFSCQTSGFYDEVMSVYHDPTIFKAFMDAFSFLPLIAIVDNYILCVHGGIGPNWYSLGQVNHISRPLNDFDSDLLNSMLWSDPNEDIDNYAPSNRGVGYLYGQNAVKEFLSKTHMKIIIRAHECVSDGYQSLFDGKLITVFGASNYCGLVGNKAAVLEVTSATKIKPRFFNPLPYLHRAQVTFEVFGIKKQKPVLAAAPKKRLLEAGSSSHLSSVTTPTIKISVANAKSPRVRKPTGNKSKHQSRTPNVYTSDGRRRQTNVSSV